MTIKDIKETFNAIANKHNREYKYKRCIKNSEQTVMFQAYHNEKTVWTNFFGIKLLDYNKVTSIATWYCKQEDINTINKYNL